jgi:hypothetical protein
MQMAGLLILQEVKALWITPCHQTTNFRESNRLYKTGKYGANYGRGIAYQMALSQEL